MKRDAESLRRSRSDRSCTSPRSSDTLAFVLARIYSAAVYGVDAYEVEIEVNAAGGNPKIVIVGLPDTAVKESQDRVTTAISNSGYYWPRGRTTINLAPADVKKEGPSFDLPIALGMIATAQEIEDDLFADMSFVGELALNGAVRAVKGVLPGRAGSAAARETRHDRARSQRPRSRDGCGDRDLRSAESAPDISVR
jgi:hypothetical protein